MATLTLARWLKRVSSILLLIGLGSAHALANYGVVFMHGTGSQTDAEDDYWTREFTQSVMQGTSTPSRYAVINCDFEQYMWDSRATGCVADQMTQFIQQQNITQMYVITHSHGGNMMRWILSNPTYDSRFPAIIQRIVNVTALAPSSAGTPLADAVINGNTFETSLGWLLGYGSNAVKQQQVSWMAYYNANYLYGTSGRPGLPVNFKSVVGTDVESAIWDSDSYCGGYQNQVGLEFTQNWLASCSDGFLECSSQEAAGSVWFRDKQRTRGSEPLSHQQSRRACFGLDRQLRNDV
ncbi:hypothetical protein LJ739_17225 [Aestuariibacter halophilus]|uniref:Uncharacterized protein n=1 Tax=Fluctibacter halophilus TaxID=226011 RepID=A0ABS8GBP3_9ALTE|nr:hypothetical protein [Aestuariibacter halophilus]MCC2617999.1 hypothetical protein [Aestuariibacter halophilus]